MSATWIDRTLQHHPAGRRCPRLVASDTGAERLSALVRDDVVRDEMEPLAFEAEDRAIVALAELARRSAAIASKTGWSRSASWLITRRISPVAVCCSSDSVSSRFRALQLL